MWIKFIKVLIEAKLLFPLLSHHLLNFSFKNKISPFPFQMIIGDMIPYIGLYQHKMQVV